MVSNLNVIPALRDILYPKAKSILDVGCGGTAYKGKENPCHNFWEVFKHIPKKMGIDINLENIIFMREKYPDSIFICMDAMLLTTGWLTLPAFDIVHCQNVIEHLNKKEALELIYWMEHIATKQVIIGTPKGFRQPNMDALNYYKQENPAERHICEFTHYDLSKMEYHIQEFVDYFLAWKRMR